MKEILSIVDHTVLKQDAVWEDIKQACDDGIKFQCATVCIPPSFVERASQYVAGKVKICTVAGFPYGYNTTAVKVFEAKNGIESGADEIDMVINIGDAKSGQFEKIEEEIRLIKEACGTHVLKVIIETCLLTDDEKIALCKAVTKAGADFIKTSTGFAGPGATVSDVALLRAEVGDKVKVKAAGGVSTIEDAKAMIAAGAERLGTSRMIKLAKEQSL